MKRFIALVVAVVLGAYLVDTIGDLTQGRPEPAQGGTQTVLVYDVATRRTARTDAEAARALWAVCESLTYHRVVAGPDEVADGWMVRMEPALGRQASARVEGCLEDLTLDRLVGRVVSMESSSVGASDPGPALSPPPR